MRSILVAPNSCRKIIEKLKLQHKHNVPELINRIATNCGVPEELKVHLQDAITDNPTVEIQYNETATSWSVKYITTQRDNKSNDDSTTSLGIGETVFRTMAPMMTPEMKRHTLDCLAIHKAAEERRVADDREARKAKMTADGRKQELDLLLQMAPHLPPEKLEHQLHDLLKRARTANADTTIQHTKRVRTANVVDRAQWLMDKQMILRKQGSLVALSYEIWDAAKATTNMTLDVAFMAIADKLQDRNLINAGICKFYTVKLMPKNARTAVPIVYYNPEKPQMPSNSIGLHIMLQKYAQCCCQMCMLYWSSACHRVWM